jgi:hypothetical protein
MIGRVVFVICLLLVLWHFKDSLPVDRSSGLGVVADSGKGISPKSVRGTFMLSDEDGKSSISLRFLNDTHFQISPDGKVWGPQFRYNMFDDKLYLNFPHEVWTMEIKGQTLYRADLRQTFTFIGK